MPNARELVVLPPHVTTWFVVGFVSMVLGDVQPDSVTSDTIKMGNVFI
jgi:hypothetical protein